MAASSFLLPHFTFQLFSGVQPSSSSVGDIVAHTVSTNSKVVRKREYYFINRDRSGVNSEVDSAQRTAFHFRLVRHWQLPNGDKRVGYLYFSLFKTAFQIFDRSVLRYSETSCILLAEMVFLRSDSATLRFISYGTVVSPLPTL